MMSWLQDDVKTRPSRWERMWVTDTELRFYVADFRQKCRLLQSSFSVSGGLIPVKLSIHSCFGRFSVLPFRFYSLFVLEHKASYVKKCFFTVSSGRIWPSTLVQHLWDELDPNQISSVLNLTDALVEAGGELRPFWQQFNSHGCWIKDKVQVVHILLATKCTNMQPQSATVLNHLPQRQRDRERPSVQTQQGWDSMTIYSKRHKDRETER